MSADARLPVNISTADDKYSRRNREIFPQPLQTQLSKKPKTFRGLLFPVLKSPEIFEHFEETDEPHSLSNSKIVDSKRRVYLNT